jgi:hypothetical protein
MAETQQVPGVGFPRLKAGVPGGKGEMITVIALFRRLFLDDVEKPFSGKPVKRIFSENILK